MEYALATGGEPFLWPGEMNRSYVQLALLDVMAAAALLCVAALGVAVSVGRRCLRRPLRVLRGEPSIDKKVV